MDTDELRFDWPSDPEPELAKPQLPPIRFELDRLVRYDRDSILDELRRVAALVDGPLTSDAFDRLGRVHSSTVRRHLGDWHSVLAQAGLGERAGRQLRVSEKMRAQAGRLMSDEELITEMKTVAQRLGTDRLPREAFRRASGLLADAVYVRRFGSWQAGLDRAGLSRPKMGQRWSDDDYFENLLVVWTHHGRPPTYAEMNLPPSRISNGGYAHRFGGWGRAKAAFVERVNRDVAESEHQPKPSPLVTPIVRARR